MVCTAHVGARSFNFLVDVGEDSNDIRFLDDMH